MPTIRYLCWAGIKLVKLQYFLESEISECIEDNDISEALEFLEALYILFPEKIVKYEDILLKIIGGKDLKNKSIMRNGMEIIFNNYDDNTFYSEEPLEDYHGIKSAYIFYSFDKNNDEVNQYIKYWSQQHPDEKVRSELNNLIHTL